MKPGSSISLFGLLICLGLAGSFVSAGGQVQEATQPPADPADVESVDAIVAAVYDVISGPAGQARDWDRWRSLFLPEARLIAVGQAPDGTQSYRVMTPGGLRTGVRRLPGANRVLRG